MPPQIVQVILYSLASFLGGGALTWRLLGRAPRERCPKLAQDVTNRVHDRCTAYQRLEERINTVIADFDRREAELRADRTGEARPTYSPGAALAAAEAQPETSTDADALSWMDACGAPVDSVFVEESDTPSADRLILDEGSAQDAEGVVDRFAQRLQTMQREKGAELDRQRRSIESLESRIQALESWSRTLSLHEREVPELLSQEVESAAAPLVAVPIWEASIRDLQDRIARSEQEIVAWHEHYEKLARERLASIDDVREIAAKKWPNPQRNQEVEAAASSVRARTAERGSKSPDLQATSATQGSPLVRPPMAHPRAASRKEARPSAVQERASRTRDTEAATPRRLGEPDPRIATNPVHVGSVQGSPQRSIDNRPRTTGEVAEQKASLDDLPGLADTKRGGLQGIGKSPDGTPSQIGQLMKNLEIAKDEAETYRRKLQEQNSHFTAAYSMLDRMRPLVEALEGELSANARGR
jgi:hypothetical protein